jgi:hypothetical protein
MNTIYVSNRGSDENDGKTRATPVYSWRRVNALCSGINEIHLIEGDATLVRLKTEIDEFDRRAAHLSDYNQEERASIIGEIKSMLGYGDSAGPPREEILNLTEERAASSEPDDEVLDLTEELIQPQRQKVVEPAPQKEGQADVSANAATHTTEGSFTDFIGNIQRQIDEALAPLKNHEGVLIRTKDPNPAQIQPDVAPLIKGPDPTSAEQALAAAANWSPTEFQIDAQMIGEIQGQIAEALAPLKNRTRYERVEEVVHLTEALIPGQEDDSPLSAESEPEKPGQGDVSASTLRSERYRTTRA